MDERWDEIRGVHKQFRTTYEVSGGFTVIMLLLLVGAILFANGVLNDYTTNVFTESVSAVASVIVTVLILDRRAEAREERRRLAELKAQFVRESGSPDNATALNALRALDAHGWLAGDDGALQNANLTFANLTKADLIEANLSGAYLGGAKLNEAELVSANLQKAKLDEAKLQEASLYFTNLQDASLRYANLQGAGLVGVNLKGANLELANLQDTDLGDADFRGANLRRASLRGATLMDTQFDEHTILPDAVPESDGSGYSSSSYWHKDTDMERYTDPDHANFWEPVQAKKARQQVPTVEIELD